jgi:glutamyl/glutaminyl-tRNA synthetase
MPNYLNLYEALDFDMQQSSERQTDEPLATSFSEISTARVSPGTEAPAETRSEAVSENDGSEKANGQELPFFAHLPHIMNEQGNKKLGKRDGAKDVLDYIRDGYLPEALVSFIATLGWNDGTEQEIFTKQELIDKFSLDRVQKSGARFDEKRLLWMNGHFIRELPLSELEARVEFFWPESAKKASESYKRDVLKLAQDRLKTLRDLPRLTSYFFEEPAPDMTLIGDNKQLRKLSNDEIKNLLQQSHDALAQLDEWTPESIQKTLNQLLDATGQKPGILFSLIRIATTWAPFSPQLNENFRGKTSVFFHKNAILRTCLQRGNARRERKKRRLVQKNKRRQNARLHCAQHQKKSSPHSKRATPHL